MDLPTHNSELTPIAELGTAGANVECVGKGLQRVLLQTSPCRDKEEVNNGSLDVGAMKELEKMQKEKERLKLRHNGTAEQSGLADQQMRELGVNLIGDMAEVRRLCQTASQRHVINEIRASMETKSRVGQPGPSTGFNRRTTRARRITGHTTGGGPKFQKDVKVFKYMGIDAPSSFTRTSDSVILSGLLPPIFMSATEAEVRHEIGEIIRNSIDGGFLQMGILSLSECPDPILMNLLHTPLSPPLPTILHILIKLSVYLWTIVLHMKQDRLECVRQDHLECVRQDHLECVRQDHLECVRQDHLECVRQDHLECVRQDHLECVRQDHLECVRQDHLECVRQDHLECVRQDHLECVRQDRLECVRQDHLECVRQDHLECVRQDHLECVRQDHLECVRQDHLECVRQDRLECVRQDHLECVRQDRLECVKQDHLMRQDRLECVRQDHLECVRQDHLECVRLEGVRQDRLECVRQDRLECVRQDRQQCVRQDHLECVRRDRLECVRQDRQQCMRQDHLECVRRDRLECVRQDRLECVRQDRLQECVRQDSLQECVRQDRLECVRQDRLQECVRQDHLECMRQDRLECVRQDPLECVRQDCLECARQDRLQECETGSSRVRETGSSRVREAGSSPGVREAGSSGVRETGSSRVREAGSSGVRETGSSGVRKAGWSRGPHISTPDNEVSTSDDEVSTPDDEVSTPNNSNCILIDSDDDEEVMPKISQVYSQKELKQLFPQFSPAAIEFVYPGLTHNFSEALEIFVNGAQAIDIIKLMRRNFVDNSCEYTLCITSETMWNAGIAFYKNQGQNLDQVIRIALQGSAVIDAGGPRRQFFTSYITADEVLSCIDSSGLNPPLRAMLNTYISIASHRDLEYFLKYCTGTVNIKPQSITVYCDNTDFIAGKTCSRQLVLPNSLETLTQDEFNELVRSIFNEKDFNTV
ncbi:hypothetical protein EMCRGX_G004516 [Ephydatia muelleri]